MKTPDCLIVYLCFTEHDVHISSDLVSLYEQYTGAVFEDINKLTTHSPIQHMEGIKVGSFMVAYIQGVSERSKQKNNLKLKKKHVVFGQYIHFVDKTTSRLSTDAKSLVFDNW